MEPVFIFLGIEFAVIFGLAGTSINAGRLFRRGEYQRAEIWYSTILKPTRFLGWAPVMTYGLGASQLQLGKFDEARENLEKAVKAAEKQRLSQLPMMRLMLAFSRVWDRDLDGARELADKLENSGRRPTGPTYFSNYLRAVIAVHSGELDSARIYLAASEAKVGKDKQTAVAIGYMQALCDFHEERYEEALKRLNALDRTTPLKLAIITTTAQTLALMNRAPEAEAMIAPLLQQRERLTQPDRQTLYASIALVARFNHDWERTRHYATEALNESGRPAQQAGSLINLAYAYAHFQNPVQARELCNQVLQMPIMPQMKARAQRLLNELNDPLARVVLTQETENPNISVFGR